MSVKRRMNDECDCGWCGKCVEQVAWQHELEDSRGDGVDYYPDDEQEDKI